MAAEAAADDPRADRARVRSRCTVASTAGVEISKVVAQAGVGRVEQLADPLEVAGAQRGDRLLDALRSR